MTNIQAAGPRPLETKEEVSDAIHDIEAMIRHADDFLVAYTDEIYNKIPLYLSLSESINDDMKGIATVRFHLNFIRTQLIVRLYEMETRGPKAVPAVIG